MQKWVGPGLVGLLLGGSIAATAQDPVILARLATGEWQLRQSGTADGATSRLCVTSPTQLVHLRQSGSGCTHVVLSEDARSATVSYSCPSGAGRTTLTLGGGGSVHIATMGLANGEPFDIDYDARPIGRCP